MSRTAALPRVGPSCCRGSAARQGFGEGKCNHSLKRMGGIRDNGLSYWSSAEADRTGGVDPLRPVVSGRFRVARIQKRSDDRYQSSSNPLVQSRHWMFSRIFGLDDRESYRKLRLELMLPSLSKPRNCSG